MIGVFDSGYGGLTVFKKIKQLLPDYSYIYLGDNARAPYGDKSQEAVYSYSKQAVDFLISKGCSLIIFACNTASAESLPKLQIEYEGKVKILGVIHPVVEKIKEDGFKKVGVMATRSTVESKKYVKEAEGIEVVQLATPLLVPLIEEGVEKKPWSKKIIKDYVKKLKSQNPEGIILGCTHYGIISKEIQNYFGNKIKVIDASQVVADKLKQYLQKHSDLEQRLDKKSSVTYLTTDDPDKFSKQAVKFLGEKIQVQKVKL